MRNFYFCTMKKIFLIFGLTISALGFSQNVKFETLLEDQISIRAIEIWRGKVWYAGSQSKFGYVDISNPKNQKQVRLDSLNQDFRTIALYPENAFTTVNIGSPAVFKNVSSNLKVSSLDRYAQSEVFFDSHKVSKAKRKNSLAISDPYNDGRPLFRITSKKFFDKSKAKLPIYAQGEAHFAASNSNIAMVKDNVWIATGGMKSRIFKFNWKNPYQWTAYETPFIQGTASTGIYSIDFYDSKFGIAVGGDYKNQSGNENNIATTKDGGKTWQIQASGKNAGYSTCVKFRPRTKGKEILAIGDQHISYSKDAGKTWTKISNETGFYACEWQDYNTVILAGNNKISKMTFN